MSDSGLGSADDHSIGSTGCRSCGAVGTAAGGGGGGGGGNGGGGGGIGCGLEISYRWERLSMAACLVRFHQVA